MDEKEIISLALNILSVVGGSGLVAALLPLKFRQYLPILVKIIDFLAANWGSAENKDPEQIKTEKQVRRYKKR